MINWDSFVSDVSKRLKEGFTSYEVLASYLSIRYLKALSEGTDFLGKNSVLAFNTALIEQAFIAMFKNSVIQNTEMDYATFLENPLKLAWSTCTIAPIKIPPGFSAVTLIKITSPGQPPKSIKSPAPTDSYEEFPRTLSNYFKGHLPSVQGLYTGLSATVPPAPLSVPFIGYN